MAKKIKKRTPKKPVSKITELPVELSEKKLSNKLNGILNYKSWTFKLNWASGVVLFAAITASVYFYVQNKAYKVKLDSLPALQAVLDEQSKSISALQSSNQTFNNIIKSFMDNPPKVLQTEIDNLSLREDKMEQFYHGTGFVPQAQPISEPPTSKKPLLIPILH